MAQYTLYAIKHNTTYVPITAATINPQIEAIVEGAGSSIDPTMSVARGYGHILTFTSPAIATLCTLCGVDGLEVGAGAVVTLYFAKKAATGFSSGADNISIALNEGLMVVNSITADQDGRAEATGTIYATYNGTNVPFVLSTVSLPAVSTTGILAELFGCYEIAIGATAVPVSSITVNYGNEVFHDRVGSEYYKTFAAIKASKPTCTFETPDIGVLLAALGESTVSDFVTTAESLTVYFVKLSHGGNFLGGSTDISFVLNDATVVLRSIGPTHNERAVASVECFGTYDGTHAAITYSAGATVPAATAQTTYYTLGKFYGDAVSFETESWSLDTGITVQHEGHSGDYRPTRANVMRRDPTFTANVYDFGNNPDLVGESKTDCVFYLQKVDQGGTRVAVGTAEHISFTVSKAHLYQNESTANWGDEGKLQITCKPVYDGTNAIVLIDTTAAIA